MGQILCALMIAGGIGLYLYLRQTEQRVKSP